MWHLSLGGGIGSLDPKPLKWQVLQGGCASVPAMLQARQHQSPRLWPVSARLTVSLSVSVSQSVGSPAPATGCHMRWC